MKKSIAVMTLASVLALHSMAQPPTPPKGPDGKGPGRPEMKEQPLQEITIYTGQAGDWVANNDYVYDGFYLQTNGTKQLVKFAPHLGEQLKASVKNGSSITVKGVEHITPDGVKEIRLMSLNAGGKMIADTGGKKPIPGSEPTEISASGNGKISEVQKGKRGETIGFVLDNKTILRMPPHVAAQLDNTATTGATISYTGNKKAMHDGEVASGNYTIIHTKTITINGKEYLVR